MRFFSLTGVLQRARRFVSRPVAVGPEDVEDPVRLAEILRQLSDRVQELEARVPPESVEFERDTVGDPFVPETMSFAHNLGCPVRWFVTYTNDTNAAPWFTVNADTTSNVLVLDSYFTGRIILRIEPSQHGVT